MLDYIGPIAIVLLLGLWVVNVINNYFDDLERREEDSFRTQYFEILDTWFKDKALSDDTRRLPDEKNI